VAKQVQARDLGDAFPPIKLASVDGGPDIDFAAFRGRRVLVFSWSSW
jgi:hypothetical protein